MAIDLTGAFEPGAESLLLELGASIDGEDVVKAAQISIAISLKRIADALQPVEITTSMDITVPPDIRTLPG